MKPAEVWHIRSNCEDKFIREQNNKYHEFIIAYNFISIMRIQFGVRFWASGGSQLVPAPFLDEIIYEHFAKWFWAFDIVYAGATSTKGGWCEGLMLSDSWCWQTSHKLCRRLSRAQVGAGGKGFPLNVTQVKLSCLTWDEDATSVGWLTRIAD